MSRRTLVIGDIHGCAGELEDLLEKLQPGGQDKVVLLGDLVNRGPASHHVVRIAREHGFLSLMGNHELRLLRYHQTRDPSLLKAYDYETLQQLRDEDWHYMKHMKAFYELPDSEHVCVHGGFIPGQPWRTQPLQSVCQTKWVPADAIPPERRQGKTSIHWSDLWEGPPMVLYGHTPYPEVRFSPYTLGIDTSCVYGGFLTACILPGMDLVQVKARKAYI